MSRLGTSPGYTCLQAVLAYIMSWTGTAANNLEFLFSSMGAEIISAATSTDRGSLMAESFKLLYGSAVRLPFVLTVHSHGLYSTVTTLHEGTDYRLRPLIARKRDSFGNEDIAAMQWISGMLILVDALTKRKLDTSRRLNEVMMSGALDPCMFEKAKRIQFN